MKWFKHDSDASLDAKLKRVRMKYGMEGYGLYWYCLELIAQNVDKNNLTFELEHDAEIISFDTGIHYERIQEMMTFMITTGLFEESGGTVTCLKLAKRLDQSMTGDSEFRKKLNDLHTSHDTIMTNPDPLMIKNRKEQKRTEKNTSAKKFANEDLLLAIWMFKQVQELAPKTKKPNMESWASVIRLMRERDNRTHGEIRAVFSWANKDDFWQTNILSPKKLREQFDRLEIQSKKASKPKKPSTDDGWINLGKQNGIPPKAGESMWDYKQRVSGVVYGR